MIEPGTRVRYTGDYYPGLTNKTGTVKFIDVEAEFSYVTFDYRPQIGTLACAQEELEVI